MVRTTTLTKPDDKSSFPNAPMTDRAASNLATSIFQQLQREGCQARDIISVSGHLLSLVTSELQKASETKST